jgi:hypothetical protein
MILTHKHPPYLRNDNWKNISLLYIYIYIFQSNLDSWMMYDDNVSLHSCKTMTFVGSKIIVTT